MTSLYSGVIGIERARLTALRVERMAELLRYAGEQAAQREAVSYFGEAWAGRKRDVPPTHDELIAWDAKVAEAKADWLVALEQAEGGEAAALRTVAGCGPADWDLYFWHVRAGQVLTASALLDTYLDGAALVLLLFGAVRSSAKQAGEVLPSPARKEIKARRRSLQRAAFPKEWLHHFGSEFGFEPDLPDDVRVGLSAVTRLRNRVAHSRAFFGYDTALNALTRNSGSADVPFQLAEEDVVQALQTTLEAAMWVDAAIKVEVFGFEPERAQDPFILEAISQLSGACGET